MCEQDTKVGNHVGEFFQSGEARFEQGKNGRRKKCRDPCGCCVFVGFMNQLPKNHGNVRSGFSPFLQAASMCGEALKGGLEAAETVDWDPRGWRF